MSAYDPKRTLGKLIAPLLWGLRRMRWLLVIAGIVVAMTACASWTDKPQLCFIDEPPIQATSPGEMKAVEFAKRHSGDGCRPAIVECHLQLRREANGQIEVVVSRASIAGKPPACTRLEGGFETYVFSA